MRSGFLSCCHPEATIVQDVIDRVREAERRAAQVHDDYTDLRERVAVLENRYSEIRDRLDGVVERQGAQGERLGNVDGSLRELHTIVSNLDARITDLKSAVTARAAGGAIGGGGLAAAVYLIVEFVLKAGGS